MQHLHLINSIFFSINGVSAFSFLQNLLSLKARECFKALDEAALRLPVPMSYGKVGGDQRYFVALLKPIPSCLFCSKFGLSWLILIVFQHSVLAPLFLQVTHGSSQVI